MRYGTLKAARYSVISFALVMMLSSCSCMHGGAGNAAPPEHVCPPCPVAVAPPIDPLADSDVDDGLSNAERTEFIRRNIAVTVRIHVTRYNETGEISFHRGTGVIINDRHVLTAAHVVRNAECITVTTRRLDPDGLTIHEITTIPMVIAGRDADTHPDIALLRVKYRNRFVESMPIVPRGWVFDEGDLLWHFGLTGRWQRGHVVGRVSPTDRRENVREMIDVDFVARAGDSGGPVVTPDGRFVGIILRQGGYFVTVDDGMDALIRVLGRPIHR